MQLIILFGRVRRRFGRDWVACDLARVRGGTGEPGWLYTSYVEKGKKLVRRQELPPEAFFSIDELRWKDRSLRRDRRDLSQAP